MPRTAWNFYDPSTLDSYDLPVNPLNGGTPPLRKNMTIVEPASLSGDAEPIIFGGQQQVPEDTLSGHLRTEAQLEAFKTWQRKSNQVRLTDDLGRVQWILITEVSFTRVKAATSPWKHQFDIKYLQVSEGA